MSSPVRLLHIISDLDSHGSERMICLLLKKLNPERFQNHVISLSARGELADRLESLGATVECLNLKGGTQLPKGFSGLIRAIMRYQPHLVETWMSQATMLGSLAAWLAKVPATVWSVDSMEDSSRRSPKAFLRHQTVCLFSRIFPERIISSSHADIDRFVERGYAHSRMELIQTGIDTDVFCPQPKEGGRVRKELGIALDAPVIGMVAPFVPEKDHASFIAAAINLQQRHPRTCFILCGEGVDESNEALLAPIRTAEDPTRFFLLGPRSDMAAVYSAFSLATLSSSAESFPIALGEAMACGIPCVATSVGDSSRLLGNTGMVVGPGDHSALSKAWETLLSQPVADYQSRGMAARQRIQQYHSLDRCARLHEQLFEELIRDAADRMPRVSAQEEAGALKEAA